MNRRAFTLVELLVVVAIIAILAMLLLTGVRTAQESGQAAQCTSNLRQLAAAVGSYAGDHNGEFVPAQDRSNQVRWHGTRSSTAAPFDPTKGPLAPYLGREGRVKLCPALREVLKESQTFEEGTGGYGYNAAYIGGTPRSPFQPERLANVPRPQRTILFTDTAFPRATGLQEYAYCEPYQWADSTGALAGPLSASVHFRHRGFANVAWCDGHVSAEPARKVDGANGYGGSGKKWTIGWLGPETENGYWNPEFAGEP